MPRIRQIDIDDYNVNQVNNALDFVIDFTGAIAPIMRNMTPGKHKDTWKKNAKAAAIAGKLRESVCS